MCDGCLLPLSSPLQAICAPSHPVILANLFVLQYQSFGASRHLESSLYSCQNRKSDVKFRRMTDTIY
ncbi:hypothetical protein C0J52_09164 [Blattella germanica]|nr:hypothetical protein C0J52_09164 [Blattella germanica]